jgi:hypothetical protein
MRHIRQVVSHLFRTWFLSVAGERLHTTTKQKYWLELIELNLQNKYQNLRFLALATSSALAMRYQPT